MPGKRESRRFLGPHILTSAQKGVDAAVFLTMEIAFFQTILLYCVFVESLRLYWPKALITPST